LQSNQGFLPDQLDVLSLKDALELLRQLFTVNPFCASHELKSESPAASRARAKYTGLIEPCVLNALRQLPANFLEIILAQQPVRGTSVTGLGRGGFRRLISALKIVDDSMILDHNLHRADCICHLARDYAPSISSEQVQACISPAG